MKRYISGLIAVVIAIGMAAFTSEKPSSDKSLASVRFQFNNTSLGESQPSNWIYAPSALCAGQNQACVIEVPDQVVTQVGSSFVIDANKLNATYGFSTLPMVSDANGTRPDPSEAVYTNIDNKN